MSPQPYDPLDYMPAELRRNMVRPYEPDYGQTTALADKPEEPGLFTWLLQGPGKLLGSEALRGGLLEQAQGGSFWHGFAQNNPLNFLFGIGPGEAKHVDFAQIRKAYGGTDVEEGFAGFLKNVGGELATSIPELFLNPFGVVGKGAQLGARVAPEAIAAARLVGLETGLQTGLRAGVAFKIPFTEILLGKLGYASEVGGFAGGAKSLALYPARALDSLALALRNQPILHSVIGTVKRLAPPGSESIDVALKTEEGARIQDRISRRFFATQTKATQDSLLGPTGELIRKGEFGDALSLMNELGLKTVDEAGTYSEFLTKALDADTVRRIGVRDAILGQEFRFPAAQGRQARLRPLWEAAQGGDMEAARTIYHGFPDMPLPSEWLGKTGLAPRVGVELSELHEGGLGQRILDAVGTGGQSSGEKARYAIESAEGVPASAKAMFQGRVNAAEQYGRLVQSIKDGTVDKAGLDLFLAENRAMLTRVGMADIAAGFLNQNAEPYLGHYLSRRITPEIADAVNARFAASLGKYNYSMARKFTDLTTVDMNAVAMDVGNKATGFIPVKDLQAGGPQSVLARIFDRKFIAAEIEPRDPHLADFFITNLAESGMGRVKDSAFRHGVKAAKEAFFDPSNPHVLATKTLAELRTDASTLADPNNVHVLYGLGDPRMETRGNMVADLVKDDARARYAIAHRTLMDDFTEKTAAAKETFGEMVQSLRDSRALDVGAQPVDRAIKQSELLGTANVKRALNQLDAAKLAQTDAEDLLRSHKMFESGGPMLGPKKGLVKGDWANATEILGDAKARYLEARKSFFGQGTAATSATAAEQFTESLKVGVSTAKQAVTDASAMLAHHKSAIDDVMAEIDDVIAGYGRQIGLVRGDRTEALRRLNEGKDTAVEALRSLTRTPENSRRIADEWLLRRRYEHSGALPLDEAQKVVLDEQTGETLFDRLMKRLDPQTKVAVVRRDNFAAFDGFWRDFSKPDPLRGNSLVKFMDELRMRWSTNVSFNPLMLKTRVNNFVQNMWSLGTHGMLDGASLGGAYEVSRAMGKLASERVPLSDSLGAAMVGGKSALSLAEAADLARNHAVIGAGLPFAEGGRIMEQGASANPKLLDYIKDIPSLMLPIKKATTSGPEWYNQGSAWYRLAMNWERRADEFHRMAGFLNQLRGGADVETAAQAVGRALYDPSRLITNTEKSVFARAIPFYRYMRYAVGDAAGLYFSRPGTQTIWEHLREAGMASPPAGGKPIDEARLNTVLPQFVKENVGVPYMNAPDGPRFLLFGSFLSTGEVAGLVNAVERVVDGFKGDLAGGQDAFRYIGQKMHPALRVMLENALNKDFYSDRDIEAYPGETTEMFGMQVPRKTALFVNQIRFINQLDRLNILNLPEAKAMIDANDRTNAGRSVPLPFGDRLLSSGFSPAPIPRAAQVDVAEQTDVRTRQDLDAYNTAKGRLLRRIVDGKTPANDADVRALQQSMLDKAAEVKKREALLNEYDQSSKLKTLRRIGRL